MKKISLLLILIASFLFTNIVYAENSMHNSDGYERTEENKYGVNKRWTIDDQNKSNVLATPYVDPSLKIYDYGNILTEDEEKELKELIDNFIKQTNMDMVILTVDEPYSYDERNEEIAADFYDYNDFGINTKQYDGILLYRNIYESDPYYNIYTFGEGQLYFDYDRCESMLDDMWPYFKGGVSYITGMKKFIDESLSYYKSGYDERYYLDESGEFHVSKGGFNPPYGWSGISGIVVSILSVLGLAKKNKMVMKSNEANDYVNRSDVKYSVQNDKLVSSITTHHKISSDSGGSHGGGYSHSGSSGGFHGGGGGRHG